MDLVPWEDSVTQGQSWQDLPHSRRSLSPAPGGCPHKCPLFSPGLQRVFAEKLALQNDMGYAIHPARGWVTGVVIKNGRNANGRADWSKRLIAGPSRLLAFLVSLQGSAAWPVTEGGQQRLQINKCLLLDRYTICSAHGEAQSSRGWMACDKKLSVESR